MKGQWIGKIKANGEGQIILNVDDLGLKYGGVAFVTPDNKEMPAITAYCQTPDKKSENNFTAFMMPVDPRTGLVALWNNIKELYPNISISEKAKIGSGLEMTVFMV